MRLMLKGGVRLDPDGSDGLISITAELLKKGTATRKAEHIAEEIEFLGSSINVSTSYDYVSLSSEFLKINFQDGLKVFADVVMNPTFPSSEVDKEIKKRFAEIDAALEEPNAIISAAFLKEIFEGHPYGKVLKGRKRSLLNIDQNTIKWHYKKYFVPNNSLLVLFGDFDKTEMLGQLKNAFADWKKGDELKFESKEQKYFSGRQLIIIDKPDVTQTQIRFGNKGMKVNDKDHYAVQVANTVFGTGFTSRLVEEIRVKRSLSYGASSSFAAYQDGGTYSISTFTKNSTVKEVFDVLFTELKKYREKGPTDKEILKSKNYLIGDFARDLQSPEMLTMYMADMIFYKRGENYLADWVNNIRNVTRREIEKVIQKYFLMDDLLMMIVTNSSEVKPQVESYGKIKEVNYLSVWE
ncbi:MAG: insulinase family protein [Bacteroidetes bacterium]|nr:insulinase family protein [Bacteroidota bacterium]MBU2586219.1 insulinase family protein [Bacteroidota bacterium]